MDVRKAKRTTKSRAFAPRAELSQRTRFVLLLAFLALCLLGGGSAREDVWSLFYLTPASIVVVALLIVVRGPSDFQAVRVPLLLVAALATIMALQLVPLPPSVWQNLPGHAFLVEASEVGEFAGSWWRPLSLTPDLTWLSLLALLFPLVALIAFAGMAPDQRMALLPVLIAATLCSALLGVFQFSTQAGFSYLYDVTHDGSAVGLFANRNHQAVLLVMIFPMLRVWAHLPTQRGESNQHRVRVALAVGLFLIPMILVTGSRSGLALALIALVPTYFMVSRQPRHRRSHHRQARKDRILQLSALVLIPILVVALFVYFDRAVAVDRFTDFRQIFQDQRIAYLPVMFDMIRDFLPFGSGFGSFDALFRIYEPDSALAPLYFNRAHNDLIELAITGGVPALLVLAALLIWWCKASVVVFFRAPAHTATALLGRLGSVMMLLLLLASLTDYPLRTPLLSVIFGVASAWLAHSQASARRRSTTGEVDARESLQ